MMKLNPLTICLGLVVALCVCSATHAVTIFEDDFESYADTAAMQAVWGAAGTGTLDPNLGNPSQSGFHPGGAQNQVTIPGFIPTPANPVIYSVDIYDDGTSANKRITAGLRNSGVANLIEMGMYNSPNHYAVRAVLPGPSWVAFSSITDDGGTPIANAPIQGWHSYKAVFDGTNVTFTLDLGGTGIINATEVLAAPYNAGFPIDTVRMGIGLSSAGGGGNFDNYLLEQVPEPGTIALLGMAAFGLVARRRR